MCESLQQFSLVEMDGTKTCKRGQVMAGTIMMEVFTSFASVNVEDTSRSSELLRAFRMPPE